MKNENVTPKKVYSDPVHQASLRVDLEKAKVCLQACLDVWDGLDLIPCMDIVSLILNPQSVYANAVNQLAEPPSTKGRFQLNKQAYIQTLEIPVPDNLYRVCRTARNQAYCVNSGLWNIEGKQVILNKAESEALIDSQSIYASSPAAVELASDLQTFVNLFNKINEKIGYELENPPTLGTQFFRNKFSFEQISYPGHFILGIIPDNLKRWMASQ